MCTHQNLAGPGPGFDSKSWELTSTTIQTDPRQRSFGPVLTPWLVRSPEVPDTLSLECPADRGGARVKRNFEKRLAAVFKRSLPVGHQRDQLKKLQRCCRIRIASNLKTE